MYLPVATGPPSKTQIVQSGGVELLLSDTTLPHWDLIAGPTGGTGEPEPGGALCNQDPAVIK